MKMSEMDPLMKTHYRGRGIQLARLVCNDILAEIRSRKNPSMLVFGMGHDSSLWFEATKGNVVFIEDNQEYIDLNSTIPRQNIIKHDYSGVDRVSSLTATDEQMEEFSRPPINKQFDVILIDGPEGFSNEKAGRRLPCLWTKKYFSKKGTLIYIDDSRRKMEKLCIEKYFPKVVETFPQRGGCDKILSEGRLGGDPQ